MNQHEVSVMGMKLLKEITIYKCIQWNPTKYEVNTKMVKYIQ
jgi:hypothetical protein